MRLRLAAEVEGNFKDVMSAFDRNLFEALKPPAGQMEIVQFTGSKKGDVVHLRFVKPIHAEWISEIVEDGESEEECWFVDKGTTLPWPLQTWTHKHIVKKIDTNTSVIVDDMSFTGKNPFLTLLLYPALFIGFYPRKKVYKRYFKDLKYANSL
jgi:ligand-binding SRPBCC domain-containing protein